MATDLTFIVIGAAIAGFIAKLIKQPLLTGYIFAGLILANLGLVHNSENVEFMARIGASLLLFLVGLEMKISDVKSVGKAAFFTGIGQILITTLVGFLICIGLGFQNTSALYIAIALTFSSTIIMIKLLSEKRELSSLYGKIVVGFLLVQDIFAILLLVVLAGISQNNFTVFSLMAIVGKLIFLLFVTWYLAGRAMSKIVDSYIANSQELLFITSIAWALGISFITAGPLGLSMEIGGFLAGLSLSKVSENFQIAAKLRPIRDFFLIIFFVTLGMKLVASDLVSILPTALVLSFFVIIIQPLIVLIIMAFLKFKKKTSFMAGLTVGQVSEFSFILMAMGLSLGQVTNKDVALVIVVGIITMTVSTYIIMSADKIYLFFKPFLKNFERNGAEDLYIPHGEELKDHIVLIGCDRTGREILSYLQKSKSQFVVVDYNPEIASQLALNGINVVYGDIGDEEIQNSVSLHDAKLIISTTSSLADNLSLLKFLKSKKTKISTIFTSHSHFDSKSLYQSGASYVIVPENLAGSHVGLILRSGDKVNKIIRKLGKGFRKRKIKK